MKELDRVALEEPVDTHAGHLPRGAEGTIVLIWRDGEAFEVEFARPFPAVITLEPRQLGPVPRQDESF